MHLLFGLDDEVSTLGLRGLVCPEVLLIRLTLGVGSFLLTLWAGRLLASVGGGPSSSTGLSPSRRSPGGMS